MFHIYFVWHESYPISKKNISIEGHKNALHKTLRKPFQQKQIYISISSENRIKSHEKQNSRQPNEVLFRLILSGEVKKSGESR